MGVRIIGLASLLILAEGAAAGNTNWESFVFQGGALAAVLWLVYYTFSTTIPRMEKAADEQARLFAESSARQAEEHTRAVQKVVETFQAEINSCRLHGEQRNQQLLGLFKDLDKNG